METFFVYKVSMVNLYNSLIINRKKYIDNPIPGQVAPILLKNMPAILPEANRR